MGRGEGESGVKLGVISTVRGTLQIQDHAGRDEPFRYGFTYSRSSLVVLYVPLLGPAAM